MIDLPRARKRGIPHASSPPNRDLGEFRRPAMQKLLWRISCLCPPRNNLRVQPCVKISLTSSGLFGPVRAPLRGETQAGWPLRAGAGTAITSQRHVNPGFLPPMPDLKLIALDDGRPRRDLCAPAGRGGPGRGRGLPQGREAVCGPGQPLRLAGSAAAAQHRWRGGVAGCASSACWAPRSAAFARATRAVLSLLAINFEAPRRA